VEVESYTVVHERDGRPGTAFVACRTPEGARAWATSTEAALLLAMTEDDLVGRAADLRPDGVVELV
jgi:acetyl-CoA C-acetyltransferase